jgi:hypothetical protein
MIEERKRWWDAVEYRISKTPLQLQQSLHFIVKHIREDDGGAAACCVTSLMDSHTMTPQSRNRRLSR